MEGWIKLHRQCLDNEIFLHDPTAWRIFEYLLLIVDYKKGVRDCGRFQISQVLGIKPTTVYQALKRLEKVKMVDIKSNNKYSVISIVKWYDYQQPDDTSNDNRLTTDKQQSDNKMTLIKNKEVIIKELISDSTQKDLVKYLVEKGIEEEMVKTEVLKFISYWTEKNLSGTRERWQMQKTFEVKKRLVTWFNNINKFGGSNGKRGYRI